VGAGFIGMIVLMAKNFKVQQTQADEPSSNPAAAPRWKVANIPRTAGWHQYTTIECLLDPTPLARRTVAKTTRTAVWYQYATLECFLDPTALARRAVAKKQRTAVWYQSTTIECFLDPTPSEVLPSTAAWYQYTKVWSPKLWVAPLSYRGTATRSALLRGKRIPFGGALSLSRNVHGKQSGKTKKIAKLLLLLSAKQAEPDNFNKVNLSLSMVRPKDQIV